MTVEFDASSYIDAEVAEHKQVAEALLRETKSSLETVLQACVRSCKAGGKLIFFGNGGSAADAQHLATELTVRFSRNRAAIPALALTTDTSALTAIGNDYDFKHIFARQLEALCKPQDIVIGISTSGSSPNVLKALDTAKNMGAYTVGFTGQTGGSLHGYCDTLLTVPSTTTARIQEMHILLGQILCGALERELGLL